MKNSNPIQYDLFRLYIKNHDIPYWYFISVAGFFLLVRHFLYGYPSQEALICGVALLCVSGVFSFFQSSCYKEILKSEIGSKKSLNEAILTVASNKILYLVPWLIIMLSPVQSDIFYDHLLGYAFLFFMIAASASSSSAYLPLFLFDVFICLISGILILTLNFDVEKTLPATLFLGAFSAYAIFLAWKINLSAVELLKKGREYEIIARKAEQANRVKSDFLAFMSHEIRTPMSGILGMARFLKETPLSEEQKEYINTISGCSETLLNTLNDAIDITKIESGKLKIIQKTFTLDDILKSSMLVVDHLAREKGLNTFIKIEESAAGYLYGDPFRVQQIVINLLNNAVKFTHQGSITVQASVQPGLSPPMIRISVTDTGIGITPEDQKKLFIQFSQIENDSSSHYRGFGLGLSISKNLVSLMEGTIGVASNPGGGTTFWFEIPYAPAPAMQQDPSPEDKAVTKATIPMNILLVEDNRINMMIATRLLEAKGHRLTTAPTGTEALERVKELLPDLILMDLNIPDGDGIEIARKIFMMGDPYAAIPVILVTANSSVSIVERCKNAGIKDCLLKPYAPEDLYFIIERHACPDPATREPNKKLSALLEVFGPEYTRHFLKSSTEEMNLLLERIESAFQKGNLPAIAGHAHELIAVSGSVGLDSICDLARKMETTCMKDTGLKLSDLLARMKTEINQVSFEGFAEDLLLT